MGERTATLHLDPQSLIADFNTLRISALSHAASISPSVSEVTIGPRSRFNETLNQNDRTNVPNSKPFENSHAVAQEFASLSQKKTDASKTMHMSPPLPDYQRLRNNLLFKTMEAKRQAAVQQAIRGRVLCSQAVIWQIKQKTSTAIALANQKFREKCSEEQRCFAEEIEKENEKSRLEEEARTQASRKEADQKLERANQLKREMDEKERCLQAITDNQAILKRHHHRYIECIHTIPTDQRILYVDINQRATELIERFNNLLQSLRKFKISNSELSIMTEITNEMEKLAIELEQEVRKRAEVSAAAAREQAAEHAAALAAEQEKQAAAQAEIQVAPPKADAVDSVIKTKVEPDPSGNSVTQAEFTAAVNSLSQLISPMRLNAYNEIMAMYSQYTEAVKVLQGDETMKSYRFNCQKAVNTPVNAISSVSPDHLWDKHDKLEGLLARNMLRIGEMEHPLGKPFCLLLLAKKFVLQGETTVSSNPQAAYPVAAILVSLWKKYPELGRMFQAYLFKACPFLVPYIQLQKQGQSNEDYCKALGYKFTDHVMENQSMYLKRMAGVARLYFAVMITPSRRGQTDPHPHTVENAWMWLTSILNIDPFPEICATLILECLQVVGWELWRSYGKQFVKLLNAIQNQYFVKLQQVDEGGPRARLEVLLSKIIKENKLDPPEGMLPPHFF